MSNASDIINELTYRSYAYHRQQGSTSDSLIKMGLGDEQMEKRYRQDLANNVVFNEPVEINLDNIEFLS